MKNQQIRFFLIVIIFCLSSCNKKDHTKPKVYTISPYDTEMNNAIETAKQTLDSFDYAFKNNSRIFTFFGLKKRFKENQIIEHVWIGNIQIKNEKYIGIIDNIPEKIKNVKLGDTLKIDKRDISDWMYIKNSKLYGGYTTRLLVKRMSKKEREQFDKESGLKI